MADLAAYTDRLQKLIPAEFIAAYLAIHNGLLSARLPESEIVQSHRYSLIALLILLPFYQYRILQRTLPAQIIISCVSFLIWAISFGYIVEWNQIYFMILIIIWTFIPPFFVGTE